MQRQITLGAVAAILLATAPRLDARSPDLKAAASSAIERELYKRIDDVRSKAEVGELNRSRKLGQIAGAFAKFMAEHQKFGHDVDGKQPGERLADEEYEYCVVLENIAYLDVDGRTPSTELADRFTTTWLDSPSHKRNLLDDAVLETGIGIAATDDGLRLYAVQVFTRPRSAAIEFHVRNDSSASIKYSYDSEEFELESGMTQTHQSCRPIILEFRSPASDEAKKFRPKPGELFVVREPMQIEVRTFRATE